MMHGQERIFNCYGRQIKISANYDACCMLRANFRKKAVEYADYYIENCYDVYGGMRRFVESGRDDGKSVIANVIEKYVIQEAIDVYGICTIDIGRFYTDYYREIAKYYSVYWEKTCDEVEKKAGEIETELQANIEYRKERKDNRDRWVGGGFGVGGAIKGAAKAGAMNMATGAAHGIFNAIGNTADRVATSSRLSGLYNESRNKIYSAIYQSIMLIARAYWKLLADNGKVSYSDSPFGQESSAREYNTFMKNFNMISNENVIFDSFPKMILIAPYNDGLYEAMYDRFGDPNNGLSDIAKYFGVDVIEKKKMAYVEAAFESVRKKLAVSEEKAKEAKTEFVEKCKQYNCLTEAEQRLKEIDDVLHDYDVKARTVKGLLCGAQIECKTREGAAKSREELEHIKSVVAGLKCEEIEEDAQKALDLLKNETLSSEVYEFYLQKLDELLQAFDRAAHTVKCGEKEVMFETREETVKQRNNPKVIATETCYQEFLSCPKKYSELQKLLSDKDIPETIKTVYKEQIAKVIEKQREIFGKSAYPTQIRTLTHVGVLVLLFVALYFWKQISWFGFKGIVFLIILDLLVGEEEIIGLLVGEKEISCQFDPTKKYVAKRSFALPSIFLLPAFDLLLNVGWQNASWVGYKGVICAMVFCALCSIMGVYEKYKEFKTSLQYLTEAAQVQDTTDKKKNKLLCSDLLAMLIIFCCSVPFIVAMVPSLEISEINRFIKNDQMSVSANNNQEEDNKEETVEQPQTENSSDSQQKDDSTLKADDTEKTAGTEKDTEYHSEADAITIDDLVSAENARQKKYVGREVTIEGCIGGFTRDRPEFVLYRGNASYDSDLEIHCYYNGDMSYLRTGQFYVVKGKIIGADEQIGYQIDVSAIQ